MSTATIKNLLQNFVGISGTPYGNGVNVLASLTTNSSGVATLSDLTTNLVTGTVVRFGLLPAGLRLEDALAIVSDAFTASETIKLGFQYVDGVDSADVPQDDDYFFAALALDAAGRTRANNTGVAPVVLAKDAYLIGTVAGANTAAAGRLDVLVFGEQVGLA